MSEPRAPASDSKTRFSDRVENYVKYRPGYPPAVLEYLTKSAGLTPQSVVADVGSGTGLSSEPFLRHGNIVYGVEPNADMRQAAERILASFPGFRSVDGSAEATTLPSESIDLIVAGQAFHWFDPVRARAEFRRILRPGGHVALIWNARRAGGTPFLEAYERMLLEHGTDYQDVGHRGVGVDPLRGFFGGDGPARATFINEQVFDFAGIKGRLLSSSYVPAAGEAHDAMLRDLRAIFDKHNEDGRVSVLYDTEVYVGVLP